MTFDHESSLNLYVDTTPIGPVGVTSPLVSRDSNVVIGEVAHLPRNNAFKGSIDDIRIYNHVLSDSEIEDLFNEHNPIPEPTTMLLFGTGLIALAGFRRKFTP